MPEIIFATPRLIARHIGPADQSDMLEVYGDEDAMRWVGDGSPISREDVIRWIQVTAENYRKRGYGMSALLWRESGEVIGFCGLVHPGGQPEAEIKYALKRSYWGRGIATEAATAMLAYGSRQHHLKYIIATTAPANLASHRVLLKAGMTRGKLLPNADGSSTQVFEWHAQTDRWQEQE
jgi:ribosomal-protein-alanine N-acetyltransferase